MTCYLEHNPVATPKMRYFVFIDESGEANMTNPDPRFDIFVLCAIVFSEESYTKFNTEMKGLKKKYFENEQVVFHSTEMRKKSGIFRIFLNPNVLKSFYIDIDKIFMEHHYKIISCVVDKPAYRERYPKRNTAYEDALTFVCERCISMVGRGHVPNTLHFCLEKRQENKDRELKRLFTKLTKYGTEFKSTNDFKICYPKLHFRGKQENINGLQWADLCAYPIARKHLSPENPQLTYELFEDKIYRNIWGIKKGYGLKYFP